MVIVIGAGLAGCEVAYQIAKQGIEVRLYEMKPKKFTPAHTNQNFAEIVCSNSFKSNAITNACGLLKEELRHLGSLLIECADKTSVPAGQALAVDREKFAELVTQRIKDMKNITIVEAEVGKDISLNEFKKEDLKYEYDGEKIITSKMESGTKLGKLSVKYQDEILYEQDIILKEKLSFDFMKYLKAHIELVVGGIGIVVIILVFIFIVIRKHRRKRKAMKQAKLRDSRS